MAQYLHLDDRAVIAVSGDDARSFLQGLITNDIARVKGDQAIHAAILTPQGKFLYEFFIVSCGDSFWLDCAAETRETLKRRLAMYRLRAKVAIDETLPLAVYAIYGSGAATAARRIDRGLAFMDPRLEALGARVLIDPRESAAIEDIGIERGSRAAYDALRIGLGVPDGARDLVPEKSFPLENGFDELNGVDFEKGCYVGQEVTARMKHRNLVRKRLVPVTFEGPPPVPGTPVTREATEVGEIRSCADGHALALIRIEDIDPARPLRAGAATVIPKKPGWARF